MSDSNMVDTSDDLQTPDPQSHQTSQTPQSPEAFTEFQFDAAFRAGNFDDIKVWFLAHPDPMIQILLRIFNRGSDLENQNKELKEAVGDYLVEFNDKSDAPAQVTEQRDTLLNMAKSFDGSLKISSSKSPGHPDPDKFDGSKIKMLTPFFQEMGVKMYQNADWWKDERERMGYFISRLEGRARSQISIDRETGEIRHANVDAIKKVLLISFGDPEEKNTASGALLVLKQGNKAFVDFIAEWTELAQLCDWNDSAFITILKAHIHDSLKARLSLTPGDQHATDAPAFIQQLRIADSTLRSLDPRYHLKKTTLDTAGIPVHSHSHTPIASSDPDAMDLSLARVGGKVIWTMKDRHRIPKNAEEKEARKGFNRAQRFCGWCSGDHPSVDCPLPSCPWEKNKSKGKD